MRITLYTTYYVDTDPRRREENEYCLRKNAECSLIHEIHVLCQKGADLGFISSPKIVEVAFGDRPQFSDFLKLINKTAYPEGISIIANTDIYFDDDLALLRYVDFDRTVLALTRWDLREDGNVYFFAHAESQDAWIFKGSFHAEIGQYYIGQYGCDNRLAWEIRNKGYRVFNPSLSLKSYHYHCSESRPYLKDGSQKYVPPPYYYVRPETLDPWWRNLKNFFFDRKRFKASKVDRILYGWSQFRYYRMRTRRTSRVKQSLPNAVAYWLKAAWYFPYRNQTGKLKPQD